MTLKEVGIVIGKKLRKRRGFNLTKPIMIDFADTEVKDKGMLIGVCGRGKTAKQAKADYCRRLRGEIIVTDAMQKTRKEIQLPPRITVK